MSTPPRQIPSRMEVLLAHQEIFLRILSFLDAPHLLVGVQAVNSYWSRMSLDPQLWKRLYLARYPHPHHSKLVYTSSHTNDSDQNGSALNTPRQLRPIARLPSRAFPPPSPISRSSSASSTAHGPAQAIRPAVTGLAIPLSRQEAAAISAEAEVGRGVRNDGVDWKMMMRLGTNWSRGNASSQSTITLPPSPSPSIASIHQPSSSEPPNCLLPPPGSGSGSEQYIALSPSFIFTSNPSSPLVTVYPASQPPSLHLGIIPPPPGWSSPSRPDNITAIAADQSVSGSYNDDGEEKIDGAGDRESRGLQADRPVRLAIFYQSGGFAVLSVRTTESGGIKSLAWSREVISPPTIRPRRRTTTYQPRIGDPVVLAILHHPVLITCTLGFHVSVYTLPLTSTSTSPNQPHHLSTLHSDVSYHPAALSLLPIPSSESTLAYRASLTYCTPVYPASWTVAAQEFDINFPTNSIDGHVDRAEDYHVLSNCEDEDEAVWPRRIKPILGVKGRVGGIGTDGRWCILSGTDNQIQVFALPGSGPTPPPSSPVLGTRRKREVQSDTGGIVHSQTLLAHSARVTSVSLSAGKCVSGGSDGRVLVWDLDRDEYGSRANVEGGKVGKTVGYVEVRSGEERVWSGAAGPRPITASATALQDQNQYSAVHGNLPHPQSISSAARSLFLPRPPMELDLEDERRIGQRRKPAIRQLVFDEEKIVGLVSGDLGQQAGDVMRGSSGGWGTGEDSGEIMKVWSFG